ncbi:hypothetical protein LIA77_09499 [Sarocladium implicatum]|nr:hypothetical protein LIA77_09499 [Sarocladium implicatum]
MHVKSQYGDLQTGSGAISHCCTACDSSGGRLSNLEIPECSKQQTDSPIRAALTQGQLFCPRSAEIVYRGTNDLAIKRGGILNCHAGERNPVQWPSPEISLPQKARSKGPRMLLEGRFSTSSASRAEHRARSIFLLIVSDGGRGGGLAYHGWPLTREIIGVGLRSGSAGRNTRAMKTTHVSLGQLCTGWTVMQYGMSTMTENPFLSPIPSEHLNWRRTITLEPGHKPQSFHSTRLTKVDLWNLSVIDCHCFARHPWGLPLGCLLPYVQNPVFDVKGENIVWHFGCADVIEGWSYAARGDPLPAFRALLGSPGLASKGPQMLLISIASTGASFPCVGDQQLSEVLG